MARRFHSVVLLAGCVLAMCSCTISARSQSLLVSAASSVRELETSGTRARRVNAPCFEGLVRFPETAILWFGKVTLSENSADARVGYNDDHLFVRVGAFDRRLWYDRSPSPADLTDWDAVSLFLDLDGNTGDVLDASAYRFEAQLVWWESRADYQAVYVGNAGSWVRATLPYTTTSFWRGNVPNDNVDDRGWALTYTIPFDSLGLGGPPVQGSVWGMALAVHDRDGVDGAPIPDQTWPEDMDSGQPATWGQLAFGMPTYHPQSAVPEGTVTVRHGLGGAIVPDVDVGGSSICGADAAPEYFPTWGELNYAGKLFANIQNLGDIGDWPCFSRYYVTFPLDLIPPGQVIISATLTLYQFGNAGAGQDPQPSLIQVLTIDQDWNEDTVTWNNAPLALENVASSWADISPEYPGEPRRWDVSLAVAQAYAAGSPLRLAMYESDWHYHSGKYFWSSDVGDYNQHMRPTVTVTWGRALAEIDKSVIPLTAEQGAQVTYTLDLLGSGNGLILTDTLPSGVSVPPDLDWEGTAIEPVYDGARHQIRWTDTPTMGQEVTIRYTVNVTIDGPAALVNAAQLLEVGGNSSTATATVIANPYLAFQPIVFRDD